MNAKQTERVRRAYAALHQAKLSTTEDVRYALQLLRETYAATMDVPMKGFTVGKPGRIPRYLGKAGSKLSDVR